MSDNSGLDMFLSICLQYPELNAVRYWADREQIILQLACNSDEKQGFLNCSINKIKESLFLFHKLAGNHPVILELEYRQEAGITIISLLRDINSISEQEIELFVVLLRQEFNNLLIEDDSSIIVAADATKKKLKNNLLKKIRQTSTGATNFLAYRKEGRVVVFNR